MPEIKSGSFIVTLEVEASYETGIGTLVARIEEEAKRMQDPPGQRVGKPVAIRDVELIGIGRKEYHP